MSRPLLLRRILGVILILAFLLAHNPAETQLVTRLAVLTLGVVGVWLALANWLATGLTLGLLALAHSQWGHPDPLRGLVYPATALAAGALVLVLLGRRFYTRMQTTRAARWQHRQPQREDQS